MEQLHLTKVEREIEVSLSICIDDKENLLTPENAYELFDKSMTLMIQKKKLARPFPTNVG